MILSKKYTRFYEIPQYLMHFFAWVCAGAMLLNLVLISCDVFMRYAFNSPIKGTTEVVVVLMAWVGYSGMAYTLLKGKHMQLGAFYDKLNGRAKHIVSFVIYLVATILFVIMLKASWNVFWASWLIREKSVASVTVYVFIGKFAAFLGWLLLAIQSTFMTVYCAVGAVMPYRVDPISIESEIPTEEALGSFVNPGIEEQTDAGKDDLCNGC